MTPLRASIALLLVTSSVPALAEEPAGAIAALAMRDALELHAPVPDGLAELPELRPPSLPAPPRSERAGSALAGAREGRQAGIDRAVEHAIDAAQDALAAARERGPAATGRAVDADGDAAIGIGRAAGTRGMVAPVQDVPPRR